MTPTDFRDDTGGELPPESAADASQAPGTAEKPASHRTTTPAPAADEPAPDEEKTVSAASTDPDTAAVPVESSDPDKTPAAGETAAVESPGPDQTTRPAAAAADEAIAADGATADDTPPPDLATRPAAAAADGAIAADEQATAGEPSADGSERGTRPGGVRPAAWTAPDDMDLADPDLLRAVVEAVLLVVDTPTSSTALAQGLGRPVADVELALQALRAEYDSYGRGLDLREVAGGWRLYTREALAPYVERFMLEGQQAKLTQAALETLAVVAYRQPVTRSRVSAIRGVNVDGVMRTLLSRGLVEECGADPETGGGLYRTTSFFLEKMGLTSLDELPSLAPLLPDTSQLDDVGLST